MEQLHLKPDQNWDGQIIITEYDAGINTVSGTLNLMQKIATIIRRGCFQQGVFYKFLYERKH
jgi:hypothetical protein